MNKKMKSFKNRSKDGKKIASQKQKKEKKNICGYFVFSYYKMNDSIKNGK